MKRLILPFMLILLSALPKQAHAIRVFYIGNSLISELPFSPNMPLMFASGQVPYIYGSHMRGGTSLDIHWFYPDSAQYQDGVHNTSNCQAGAWPVGLKNL